MTLSAAICMSPFTMTEVLDTTAGRVVGIRPSSGGGPPLLLTPAGRHVFVQLALYETPIGFEAPESFEIVPLSTFLPRDGEMVDLGSLVIPAQGNPARYPWDSYGVNRFVHLYLSHKAHPALLPNEVAPGVEFPFSQPAEIKVFEGPAVAPLTLDAETEERVFTLGGPTELALSLQLHRTGLTRAYVILILAIPPLLECLLVLFLWRGRPENEDRRPGFETLAGVAAVLFAILPIRLVLVPSGIGELTLVDFMLGLEVAVLAAIACVAAGLALEPLRPTGPSDDTGALPERARG